MQPRGDDRQLLLHAVRVCCDRLRQIVGQLKKRRVLFHPLHARGRVHAENIGDKIEILPARHELVQVGVIGDVRKQPLARQRLFPDGVAGDGDLTLVKLQNARHGFERGRFARAVVPDKAVNFARGDVQIQIVHGFFLAVALCQMPD